MGKEMRDMIKKENKLCFQHRMERKTEKSFQLSAGRQRLLAETIRELKQEGRLDEEKLAMQHGTTSIYRHSLNVAYTSLWMMERWQIRLEPKSLVRGALLHDYFLYDWHMPNSAQKWHGFRHARIALQNAARDFDLNKIEIDIIRKHMFPLNLRIPRYRESFIVCLADKICAIRELSLFCRWQSVILEVESKTVSCA